VISPEPHPSSRSRTAKEHGPRRAVQQLRSLISPGNLAAGPSRATPWPAGNAQARAIPSSASVL
jgi:hypothetical protein